MGKLKAYTAFNNVAGPEEGAFLVFAYTAKEAKKIAWPIARDTICDDGYFTELGIRQIKQAPWLFFEMVKDEPHVIENPKSCDACFRWGHTPILEDGLCEECHNENPDSL